MVKYELRQFSGKTYYVDISGEILDDLNSVYVGNVGIYLIIHGIIQVIILEALNRFQVFLEVCDASYVAGSVSGKSK